MSTLSLANCILKRLSMSVIAFLLFFISPALGQEIWTTDGPVYALARMGNTLYAGGVFERVGPPTGSFAVSDPTTGIAQSGWPRVVGIIYSIISDGSGGWFIGGEITQVGDSIRKNIAHILPDKSVDPNFAPNANDHVYAMALDGPTLYVGGNFEYIGGETRKYIAAIDTSTGKATSWNPGANGSVFALVFNNTHSTLYIGGNFSGAESFGGELRNYAAAVDVASGAVTAWNPNANGEVRALAVYPAPPSATLNIIMGGAFQGASSLGGGNHDYLGGVNTTTGAAAAWFPDANGEVYAIETVGGSAIYVAGGFSELGGSPRNFIGSVSPGTGLALAWNPGASSSLYALHKMGNTLYAAGYFSTIASTSQKGIAAFDLTTGNLTAFNPSIGDSARAIASDGTAVAFGGTFTSTGMLSRKSLAAFDVSTGQATSLDLPVDGVVTSLALVGDTLYIGGTFGSIGGQLRTSLAAIDSAGNVLDFNGNAIGVLWDMESYGDTLYLCGIFNSVLGSARKNLASIDLSSKTLTSWDPSANGPCRAISIDSDGLAYVGGDFTQIGTTARKYAASFHASGVLTGWNTAPNGPLWDILVDDNYIYAGGYFSGIGGEPRDYLAQFLRSTGALTAWDPQPSGPVQEMAFFSGKLIVGGFFGAIGQGVRAGIAALDPISGIADDWNPYMPYSTIMALNASANRLYVGGDFTGIYYEPYSNIANITPLNPAVLPAAPSGTAKDGETLSVVDDGTWYGFGAITKSREWQRCAASGVGCYSLSGQTGSSYILGAQDVGSAVRIYVTADDSLMCSETGGATSAIISPKNTKLPKIFGQPRLGQILSSSAGNWNGVPELSYKYNWQRCTKKKCKNIPNAKAASYKVKVKDIGKKLQLIVQASKNGSSPTAASSKKTKAVRR